MIDEEVNTILRQIRERVVLEQRHSGKTTDDPDSERPGSENGSGQYAHVNHQGVDNKAPEKLNSHLTITERTWDRLPPIVSNRRGALAKLELWVKRRAKTATRWFTWEQVNFNAAVHQALLDASQIFSDQAREIASQQSESQQNRERTDVLRDEIFAELKAESEVQRRLLSELGSELRSESESLRIEIEKRRIEINTLRAQLRTSSRDQPKAAALFAEPRIVRNLNDCFFYHSMDIPGQGSVTGHWDLRGHESEYLGEVSFQGKSVLEIGPASGHLSFFMEKNGADVVSIDADDNYEWEFAWDTPESASDELASKLAAHREMMRRLKNSYWFAHAAFNSTARVHYGSAYAIPSELGRFDVSVIAAVLLHNKNPLKILENCAGLTNDTMIIVEPFRETQLTQSAAEFLPKATESLWHTWWAFSPVYFVDILRSMGFPESRVTFHRQIWQGQPIALFTIVARRGQTNIVSQSDTPIDLAVSSVVEQLHIKAGSLTRIPVGVLNRSETPVSSSTHPPVLLSYHWMSESGEIVEWDGLRTNFPRTLYPGDREDLMMIVRAPANPGSYFLDISLVKERRKWCDEEVPGLPLRIKTTVSEGQIEN